MLAPLKRGLKEDWGLRRKTTNMWLKVLMMPIALYCAEVWQSLTMTVKGRLRTDSLHRVALLACVRTCRTVSTEAIQVIAGAIPWDLEVARLTIRYKIRRGLRIDHTDLITDDEREFSPEI